MQQHVGGCNTVNARLQTFFRHYTGRGGEGIIVEISVDVG